jgi:predicted Zn-dependent peptidase
MTALSARLDELYGAQLEPAVRKKGEVQCVGLLADFVDGAFLPGGPDQLAAAAALLGEALLAPAGGGDGFVPAYVVTERDNLADRIAAAKNDPRAYAEQRLLALMCAGEAYGTDRLGNETSARAVTPDALWAHYRHVLASSRIEAVYVGPRGPEAVTARLREALSGLPRTAPFDDVGTAVRSSAGAIRRFAESMAVSQGKLVLGMRLGVSTPHQDYPAALLAAELFGGGASSKLFSHVRERLRLCYYASAWLEGHKGLLLVSSGVDEGNRRDAEAEILAQWDALGQGDFTETELTAARLSLTDMLRATADRPHRLEDYYLGLSAAGLSFPPDELAERLGSVAPERVAETARGGVWDGVYFLGGEREATL